MTVTSTDSQSTINALDTGQPAMRLLTQRQRHLLQAVDNCIGGFPLQCMTVAARRSTRALQQRGLIRKHKTLAALTRAGHHALTLQAQP